MLTMGRIAEAADDARRSLALAREGDYPVAQAVALAVLGLVACVNGDRDGAVERPGRRSRPRPTCTARRPGCAATS